MMSFLKLSIWGQGQLQTPSSLPLTMALLPFLEQGRESSFLTGVLATLP